MHTTSPVYLYQHYTYLAVAYVGGAVQWLAVCGLTCYRVLREGCSFHKKLWSPQQPSPKGTYMQYAWWTDCVGISLAYTLRGEGRGGNPHHPLPVTSTLHVLYVYMYCIFFCEYKLVLAFLWSVYALSVYSTFPYLGFLGTIWCGPPPSVGSGAAVRVCDLLEDQCHAVHCTTEPQEGWSEHEGT